MNADSSTKDVFIKLPLSWDSYLMVERNLTTLNTYCKFFTSVNKFHSHWLRILCDNGRISILMYSGLLSYPIREPKKINIRFPLLWSTRSLRTTMEWGSVGLYNISSFLPAPLYLQVCLKNPLQWVISSPQNGWEGASTVAGPWHRPNIC